MQCKIVEDITNSSRRQKNFVKDPMFSRVETLQAGGGTTHVQFLGAPSDQAAN